MEEHLTPNPAETALHDSLTPEDDPERSSMQQEGESSGLSLKDTSDLTEKATPDVPQADDRESPVAEVLEEQNAFGESSVAKVDEKTVEKLTYSVLAHYLPGLQRAQSSLHSMTEHQRILIETIQQENTKFNESQSLKDFTETMEKAKLYHTKLLNIRKEMVAIHEKSTNIKKRAIKLQQYKQREALQKEQDREKELERERRLVAKPPKK